MNGRRVFLLGTGATLLLSGCTTSSLLSLSGGDTEDGVATGASLGPVNALRARAGQPALSGNRTLSQAALDHARWMAARGRMDHTGFARRIKRAAIQLPAAENVALGQADVDAVIAAFYDSPHHRENMLGDFAQLGLAFARDSRSGMRPYWAMELSA